MKNNKMVRNRFAMGITTISILLVTACGNSSSPTVPANSENQTENQSTDTAGSKDKYVIGFSNSQSANVWRSLAVAEIQQEAEKYDDVELIVLDGQNDISKQVSDIENLVSQNVDCIITFCGSPNACEPALLEAKQKGILVIPCSDPLMNTDSYDFFIGPDYYDMWTGITRQFFDSIGGEGDIVVLGGIATANQTIQTLAAFNDVLEEYPNIHVLDTKYGENKEENGKNIMTDWLMAYGDQIDGVFADSSACVCGAIKAYIEQDMPLVSFTFTNAYQNIFSLYNQYHETNENFWFIEGPSYHQSPAMALNLAVGILKDEMKLEDVPVTEDTKRYIMDDVIISSDDFSEYYNPELPDSMFADHILDEEHLNLYLKSAN